MRELIGKLRRLFTRREKVHAILILGAMLIGALLEMVGVGAIPAFVSVISNPEAVYSNPFGQWFVETLGLTTTEQLLLSGAAALLAVFIVKNAYLAMFSWIHAKFAFTLQVGLARRLFATYLHSPYAFHLRRNTAELLRNTNHDAMEVVGAGLIPLMRLIMETLTATAILVLLLLVEPIITLVTFVVLGGTTALFLRLVRRRVLRAGEDERRHQAGMIRAVNEGLGGIKITKVLGRAGHFLGAFNRYSAGYAVTRRLRQVLNECPRMVLETVAVAAFLSVSAMLIAQGRPVASLVPTLALLAMAVVRMLPSFNRILVSIDSLRFGRASIENFFSDLMTLERPKPVVPEPLGFSENIRLDGVTYVYPGASSPALNDVSLELRKDDVHGLVGPTGSGKTTLVDLILGLLRPSAGRVLVDGVDIRGREEAWQRQIGYVPQEIYLMDDTIRCNVAFGLSGEDIDDEAVWRAVEAAQIAEFIEELPDGIETVVGERGVRLSGGQRQRIGIARALYHDPSVLIMDEATNALDYGTEGAVMEAVYHLRGSRTILLIAHRLTTIEVCDRVFEVHAGRVWERLNAAPLVARRQPIAPV